ncbi:type VI secretion system Vgr family protein [Paraburkholderia caffeinilytica]|uniref:type VI secretion system Vgr family protein n=1 Tax=Paraburkholderia caffeinilytica TaxID=1761016 RepID=UPI003DA11210
MNPNDLPGAFASLALSEANRPFRLNWGETGHTHSPHRSLERVLIPQRLDISEGLCTGIEGHITCLSSCAGLPLTTFIGLPVGVQLVTDRGGLHSICGIVTHARAGESDGSLATYQLTIRDALSVLERRTSTRIFRQKSLPDILETLLREWQQKSPTLGRAFDFDLSGLDRARYPAREQTVQFQESDADFIRRLCRRDGIAWFVAAGARTQAMDNRRNSLPVHTLVLFDDAMKLRESTTGTVRYHRDAATEERDSVTLWSASRELVPGQVRRVSWDYKSGQMAQADETTLIDQGEAGNDLGRLLRDAVIDVPHAGDSWADYHRLGRARILAHEMRAARIDGAGSVRDLAVGHWFGLSDHPELDSQPPQDRQFVVTRLHHTGENSLPKALNEHAQALFAASRWASGARFRQDQPGSAATDDIIESRYENTFTCVKRDVPLKPAYDPRVDLPRVHPLTAIVVGPKDEEVYCDEYGRIKVQLQGLDPDDHAHAQGAGTRGTDADSTFVRVSSAWAGPGYGDDVLPRVGMEVMLDFVGGDPDRMFVSGVLHNGPNRPATFSHTGGLPGNRYLSGRKTKEVKGRRANQLRFDDSPGEISAQLASDHAASELNLGFLTHPRADGHGEKRGEGAELRTDGVAVMRAAIGMMLTTFARNKAAGHQLDRQELGQLLGECTELFRALGDYVGLHGGRAGDVTAQNQLAALLKNLEADNTSGTAAPADTQGNTHDATHGIMAFGAAAGSLILTPKTHLIYAGGNIDQVAQHHLQLMSGQRLDATAGQGMQFFSRGVGIRATAGEGPFTLQAQHDTLSVTAQKAVHILANEDEVVISGKKVRLVAEDGSYLLIGNGITLGTNGDAKILAASHLWSGPSTDHVDRPGFANAPTDQRFRLHYPNDTEKGPVPAVSRSYRITLDDGRVVEGMADAHGLTDLSKDDVMRIVSVDILKHRL